MSNLLQKIKQQLLSTDSHTFDREIELWANLYSLTKQQQQLAYALLPCLKQLESSLRIETEQIIIQDTLLRRTKGALLKKADQISDPTIKKHVLALLEQ